MEHASHRLGFRVASFLVPLLFQSLVSVTIVLVSYRWSGLLPTWLVDFEHYGLTVVSIGIGLVLLRRGWNTTTAGILAYVLLMLVALIIWSYSVLALVFGITA